MGLPDAFDDLRDKRMWVAWADEGGRKVPKSPHGGNARSNDPSTWGTYAEAEAARAKNGYSGVGLMLTDGYIGIDLDGAVEDGAVAGWAQEIIDSLDSYAELSPSGTGVHVIGWSNVEQVGPIGRNNRRGVEAYNHGRYFTVTGDAVNDAPIMDVTPDIEEFIYAHFPGESPEQAVRRRVGNLARDQVKRMANRTMAENCARDGVRYARVPRGAETCGFCIMLASRGFVYTTPEAASHAHDGCDCKVVPGFDGTEVEGYDPDSMYDLYREARERAGRKTDHEISREIESILVERDAMLNKRSRLGTRADPAVEYYGSAESENPERLSEIMRDLESEGVRISVGPRGRENIGYSPASGGDPSTATVHATEGMSLSAWEHEYAHFLFDREHGYPGTIRSLFDAEYRRRSEETAYGTEIDMARKKGNNELVGKLEALLAEEVERIVNP